MYWPETDLSHRSRLTLLVPFPVKSVNRLQWMTAALPYGARTSRGPTKDLYTSLRSGLNYLSNWFGFRQIQLFCEFKSFSEVAECSTSFKEDRGQLIRLIAQAMFLLSMKWTKAIWAQVAKSHKNNSLP